MSLGISQTSLILVIEVPALNVSAQLTFSIKPSQQNHILESIDDVVQVVISEFEDDLVSVDSEGTVGRLERLRKQAMSELEEWQMRLKVADEWRIKVERAAQQMNVMREEYFREIAILREQVYQKQAIESNGGTFIPMEMKTFDPRVYSIEDKSEATKKEIEEMQKVHAKSLKDQEKKFNARILMLQEQVATSKMLLSRKEAQMDKYLAKMGKDTKGGAAPPRPVAAASEQAEDTDLVKIDFIKEQAEDESPQKQVEVDPTLALERFKHHLTNKFGNLDDAMEQLKTMYTADKPMSTCDFKKWAGELDFSDKLDVPALFWLFTGKSMTNLVEILAHVSGKPLERKEPSIKSPSRAPGYTPRRNLIDKPGSRRISSDKGTKLTEEPFFSDDTDEENTPKETHSGRKANKRGMTAPSSLKIPQKKKADISVNTKVTMNCGIEAAFNTGDGQWHVGETMDRGTDAMPYEAAFGKKLVSRGCQSYIDGRMLDKAEDFFDEVAEANWDDLAGIVRDGKDGSEDTQEEEAEKDAPVGEAKTAADAASGGDEAAATAGEPGAAPAETNIAAVADTAVGVAAALPAAAVNEVAMRSTTSPPRGDVAIPSRRAIAAKVVTADAEVQCEMGEFLSKDADPVAVLAALQKYLSKDADPHDVNIEQLWEMAHEIEDKVPATRIRARKLSDEAPEDAANRALLDRIEGEIDIPGKSAKRGMAKTTSLAGVLSKHGVGLAGGIDLGDPENYPTQQHYSETQYRRPAGARPVNHHSAQKDDAGRPMSTAHSSRPGKLTVHLPVDTQRSSARSKTVQIGGVVGRTPQESPNDKSEGEEPLALGLGLPKAQKAVTARPLTARDETAALKEKAKRRWLEEVPQAPEPPQARTGADSPDFSALSPGWSGMTEPNFSPRNVPFERAAAESAEPERLSSSTRRKAATGIIRGRSNLAATTVSPVLEQGRDSRSLLEQGRDSRDSIGEAKHAEDDKIDCDLHDRKRKSSWDMSAEHSLSFGEEPQAPHMINLHSVISAASTTMSIDSEKGAPSQSTAGAGTRLPALGRQQERAQTAGGPRAAPQLMTLADDAAAEMRMAVSHSRAAASRAAVLDLRKTKPIQGPAVRGPGFYDPEVAFDSEQERISYGTHEYLSSRPGTKEASSRPGTKEAVARSATKEAREESEKPQKRRPSGGASPSFAAAPMVTAIKLPASPMSASSNASPSASSTATPKGRIRSASREPPSRPASEQSTTQGYSASDAVDEEAPYDAGNARTRMETIESENLVALAHSRERAGSVLGGFVQVAMAGLAAAAQAVKGSASTSPTLAATTATGSNFGGGAITMPVIPNVRPPPSDDKAAGFKRKAPANSKFRS